MTLLSMQRAPRMQIINTVTGSVFRPQFNPTEIREAISVNFARQQVPGLSHEVMQFVNTGNRTFSVELFFQSGSTTITKALPPSQPFHHFVRSRLRELVYPRAAGGIAEGGPPRALLVFPGFITFTGYLTSLEFNFQRFNSQNQPVAFTASTTWEEVRDIIRLSGEVRGLKNE